MVEVDLSIIFAGLSIAASIVYYASVLRNQNKTRQAQLFTQIYSDMRKPESLRLLSKALQMNWDDYDDFQRKYNMIEHAEERMPYSYSSMFYQEMGVLAKENLIDISLIDQFLPDSFRMYWKKFEQIILEHRQRTKYPQYFAGMEYLYREFCKYRGYELD